MYNFTQDVREASMAACHLLTSVVVHTLSHIQVEWAFFLNVTRAVHESRI